MTQKLLTLPFRIGFGAARTAIDLSAKTLDLSLHLAGSAIDTFWPGSSSESAEPDRQPSASDTHTDAPTSATTTDTATGTGAATATTTATDRPARPKPARESRVNGHGTQHAPATPPASAQPAPAPPPEQQPDTPLSPQQDAIKTIADEEEVVAEFAEPGAEDGAGAQIEVDEPWDGYAEMNASAIIGRIDQAGAAELALLELYEQMHKKRQTVLSAAAKRLRALSPPQDS